MMNYIDEKITTWKRYHIKEGVDVKKIVEVLKKPGGCMNDLDFEEYFDEYESLDSVDEPLTPEENQFNPTIEVFEGYNNIWSNYNYKE